jgi:hypothetical protein
MDELRTIGVLNEKDGLDGVHGTALRSLNIEAVTVFQWVSWLPAGVPDSRGEQECQIRGPEVPDTRAEVPDRKAGVPRMGGTQPPRPTVTQPPTTATSNTAEVVAFSLKRYEATIGTLGWIQKERFDVLLAEHGAPDVHRALAAIVKDGFGEVRTSKWAIALHRLPQKIAELQAAIADADRRAKEQVNIDTNIEYQITENILGWETQWRDDFTMTDDERSLLAQVRSCGRGYDIATARALIKRHSEWRIYKRDEESCTADDFFGAEATP